MSETTTPPAESTPDQESGRLSKIESDLNSLESKLKRDARLTLIVAVIALCLMTAYFVYGYQQFASILKPTELVATVAGMVDENIEPARESLVAEIEKSAPTWAESLSIQAIEATPSLRESLEEYILSQSEESIGKVVSLTEDRFKGILSQHHDEVQNLVTELTTNEQASKEVIDALQQVLNDEIGRDMQANAGEVLETLNLLTHRVDKLAKGKNLSEEEKLERQALMIVRRLQLEEADDSLEVSGSDIQPQKATSGNPESPEESSTEDPVEPELSSEETESTEEEPSSTELEGEKVETAEEPEADDS